MTEKIDLIASGYDWICPACGTSGELPVAVVEMNCPNCNTTLKIDKIIHAANDYVLSKVAY